ncbi:hypothetical protein [uncultured Methylobacterium sp.]|uniref:hypothetical protein n=1 Tax=uncultured Methylobacterium sp. TaxID=157278 RepID=UPI0035CBEBA5
MGERFKPAPPEVRAAVARLMRETGHSVRAIALTTGLSASTIRDWNRQEGWRPLRVRRRCWDAALPRLAALERLSRRAPRRPAPEAGPVASQAPARADAAREPAHDTEGGAADLPALRRRLRAHVGRQIAAFDAALRGEGAAVIDSARVLRDLGGLKRLLDDLDGEGDDGGHDASGAPGSARDRDLDLPALRESIARRYARLSGERPDGGVPGAPAGAAPAGAVP